MNKLEFAVGKYSVTFDRSVLGLVLQTGTILLEDEHLYAESTLGHSVKM